MRLCVETFISKLYARSLQLEMAELPVAIPMNLDITNTPCKRYLIKVEEKKAVLPKIVCHTQNKQKFPQV